MSYRDVDILSSNVKMKDEIATSDLGDLAEGLSKLHTVKPSTKLLFYLSAVKHLASPGKNPKPQRHPQSISTGSSEILLQDVPPVAESSHVGGDSERVELDVASKRIEALESQLARYALDLIPYATNSSVEDDFEEEDSDQEFIEKMVNNAILGFSPSKGGPISLTPIQDPTRHIQLFKFHPLHLWSIHSIPEPWHDSNKLFMSCRGLPLDARTKLDLEDLGLTVTQKILANASPSSTSSVCLVGGSWVDADDRILPTTRVALCWNEGEVEDKWTIKIVSADQVLLFDGKGGLASDAWNVGAMQALVTPVTSEQWVIPVLMPIRHETASGVVGVIRVIGFGLVANEKEKKKSSEMDKLYGAIAAPSTAKPLPLPIKDCLRNGRPVSVTALTSDADEKTITAIHNLLNHELRAGNSYPFEHEMDRQGFLNYFLSHNAFVVTDEENGDILGSFYIKVCLGFREIGRLPKGARVKKEDGTEVFEDVIMFHYDFTEDASHLKSH
ncbi:hypothetical protein HDU67_000156 [Dinochytrium kinnereticum]|nr:hypothetical protein HDU67_000156 [Dinochytrium kinnereticum]